MRYMPGAAHVYRPKVPTDVGADAIIMAVGEVECSRGGLI